MDSDHSASKNESELDGDASEREGMGSSMAESAKEVAEHVSKKLKTVGIDADGVIGMAEQRATDLQEMLMEEIRERPLRALGFAAAAGVILGIMSAR